jgi:catalase
MKHPAPALPLRVFGRPAMLSTTVAAMLTAAGCTSTPPTADKMAAKPATVDNKPMTAPAVADTTSPVVLVDALNGVFGKHAARASHAKGFCFAGQLEAGAGAASLTRAAMFQPGRRTPVIGRFSIGGGNPKAPDNARSIRGIAVRAVDGNERLDWVFVSAPHFFAQTPAQFAEFLKVRAPDPATGRPNAEAIAAFSKANPATTKQAAYIGAQPVPASYASVPYWSTNTFFARNAAGQAQPIRWRLEPAAGRLGLSDGAGLLKGKGARRPIPAPVAFNVVAQLAQPGDQLLDPTEPWPADRAERVLGRVVIDRITDAACERETFIPTSLPAGLEPSNDPVLQARAAAYGVSLSRRLAP